MSQFFVWTLSDVIGLVFTVVIVVIWLILYMRRHAAETACNHDGGVNETSACDAICRKCGKNLGFIGTWRERDK